MFYIISIVIAIANLSLGVLVYKKNRRFINKLFLILTVLIFIWIISNGLADYVKSISGAMD